MATPSKTDPDAAEGWARSGSGWSDVEPSAAPLDPPAFAADPARYQEIDRLGAGGMGVVSVVHDRLLDRELALKRVAPDRDDPAAAARLAREAQVTARLDHPGIIAVYDAGLDELGRPFYTMRLVRGRSLAEALAASPPASMMLLRRLTAACEAMAYAHGRGVIHRDLKPPNIMVGPYGETQIVDWGLARRIDRSDDDGAALAGGTPAYMSPERARGEEDDRRGDVWALGAIAYEVATGRPVWPTDRSAEILASLRGARPPALAWSAAAPPELRAIITRALAWDPADRYPDAGALAADLERFLDGRRVLAYEYSSFELARRLVRAWRWQLALGLVAVIALATTVAWRRIEAARRRAVIAERSTAAAFTRSNAALGEVLAIRAVTAHDAGATAEAEVLAAASLRAVESPEARGVLAATAAEPHALHARRVDLPDCDVVIAGDDERALCTAGDALELWQLASPARRWRRALTPADAIVAGDDAVAVTVPGEGLLVLDAATGAPRWRVPIEHRGLTLLRPGGGDRVWFHDDLDLLAIDLASGNVHTHARPCGGQRIEAAFADRARVALACRDGRVLLGPIDGALAPAGSATLPDPSEVVSALAVAADGRTLALGGVRGALQVVALAPWRPAPPRRARGARISRLVFVGDALIVQGDQGGAALWPVDGARAGLQLPAAASRTVEVVGDHLISTGAAWWRWELDPAPAPRGWSGPLGVNDLAAAPGGGLVAAAHAAGTVDVWSRATGAITVLSLGSLPVKAVAFSDDGQRLAVAIAIAPGLRLFEVGSWRPLPTADLDGVRDLGFLPDGSLHAFHYGMFASHLRGDAVEVTPSLGVLDASRPSGAAVLTLMADQGAIVELGPGGVVARAHDAGGAEVVALGGDRYAVGHAAGVRVVDERGTVAWLPTDGARVLDLAVARDGRWLAAAGIDGVVRVWSTATWTRVANLRGHGQRVAALVFSDDGLLWSGSWDGAVRSWDPRAFDRSAAELQAEVDARWALLLPQVP